jgi:hypothetical protein
MNGVISTPYIHGVVQCAGNAVMGATCVAPLIDISNDTANPIFIHYASRRDILFVSDTSRIIVQPSEKTLITGLLPGSLVSSAVSFLAIGFSEGDFDVYALTFTSQAGYKFVQAAGHFGLGAGGETTRISNVLQTSLTPTKGIFPLVYAGCAHPAWPWGLVFTVAVKGPMKRGGTPCMALADWAGK